MDKDKRVTEEELAFAGTWAALRGRSYTSWTKHLRSTMADSVKELCMLVESKVGYVDPAVFRFDKYPILMDGITAIEEDLLDLLEDDLETLVGMASYDDSLWFWVLSEYHVHDKMHEYVKMFFKEMESLIAASVLTAGGTSRMRSDLLSVFTDPWKSVLWKEAVDRVKSGAMVSADILSDLGVSYGSGHSNVSAHLMEVLGVGSLGQAYLREQMMDSGDVKEFMSVTADYNACPNCVAEEKNGWQSIDKFVGPWHPYCRCSFIFR